MVGVVIVTTILSNESEREGGKVLFCMPQNSIAQLLLSYKPVKIDEKPKQFLALKQFQSPFEVTRLPNPSRSMS